MLAEPLRRAFPPSLLERIKKYEIVAPKHEGFG
jgi:hypothetical protein